MPLLNKLMTQKLFTTITGSHVWNMETSKSDIDTTEVFISSSKNLLSGKQPPRTKFETGSTDKTTIEIGFLIENLIKNNINAITIVASPFSTYELKNYKEELLTILKNNISKNCFYSIHGLGKSNYKKYIESERNITPKKLNTICRVLQFGITLLDTHEIKFKPFYNGTPEKIESLLSQLQESYLKSTLLEKSDEKPFREFLFSLRKKELDSVL